MRIAAYLDELTDAGLLLDRWEPDRLERFLAVDEPRLVTDILIEHSDMPPAEFEEWVRLPFRGDLHSLVGNTTMHLWREMFPDGSAAIRAARALGIEGRGMPLTYRASSTSPDLPFPSEARREAVDDFGLGQAHLDLLDPLSPVPTPVFGALARFRLAGWTSDEQVLAALPPTPGTPLTVALPQFARAACLSPAELRHWPAMLTAVGPSPLPLPEIWRLCGPALTWRRTGLPPEVAPWCAAARLRPSEALAMHQSGTLNVPGLKALALLNR